VRECELQAKFPELPKYPTDNIHIADPDAFQVAHMLHKLAQELESGAGKR